MTTPPTNIFTLAPDGIDPSRIPCKRVSSGAEIPVIGLGTFGSDHVAGEEVAASVLGAAAVGYRHFDCAAVYGNEAMIGQSFAKILAGGIPRESLWITSKLWNDKHATDDVIPACRQSLADLQVDYLDLYLVHWPFPNYHPPHCDVTSRCLNARPYIHDAFMQTWRQMETLVRLGLVKHIGTSNMTIPKLQLLLRDADIAPACNEMELHPHFQQPELFRFVTEHDIVPIGYSPLGSPGRPARDRTPEDTTDIDDPVIIDIARRHGTHPATICLKWAIQRGQIPIPFSVRRANYLNNLRCVVSETLAEDDMRAIAAIDRNCRLIKGQVFLWKDGQHWQDLWDPDGVVTQP